MKEWCDSFWKQRKARLRLYHLKSNGVLKAFNIIVRLNGFFCQGAQVGDKIP